MRGGYRMRKYFELFPRTASYLNTMILDTWAIFLAFIIYTGGKTCDVALALLIHDSSFHYEKV
jgi:hypothetical protein